MTSLKKISKGQWDKRAAKSWWILFAAYPANAKFGFKGDYPTIDLSPGHSFVIFGVRDRKGKNWESVDAYGGRPLPDKSLSWGVVPGEIAMESVKTVGAASNVLAVSVTKQMFTYSHRNVSVLSDFPRDWDVYNLNCNRFVELVAKSLSLVVPRSVSVFPTKFIKLLSELN